MGDLISRSALIEKLKRSRLCHAQTSREVNLLKRCEDIVGEQPTAYDLDKVVEQLEERIGGYVKQYAETFEPYSRGCYESYDDAIDIVKRGGVDE